MQLNNKMCGFYRAKAMLDGKEEYMAVTKALADQNLKDNALIFMKRRS